MKRYNIIQRDNRKYGRVLSLIYDKQNGLCHFCRQLFMEEEKEAIVSAGNNLRKYYHLNCAEKIHIL